MMQKNEPRLLILGAAENGAAHLVSLRPHVQMQGFIDSDPAKAGQRFCGYPVYPPEALTQLDFDILVIASSWGIDITHELLYTYQVPQKKVLDYAGRLHSETALLHRPAKGEILLAAGNSYAEIGLRDKGFDVTLANLALSSQDIETSSLLLHKVLAQREKNTINYCILSLYHYIFDYSIAERARIQKKDTYRFLHETEDSPFSYADLFYESLNYTVRNSFTRTLTKKECIQAVADAEFRSGKEYPETRKKNINILEDIIALLQKNTIQPVFVTMPMHKEYVKAINPVQYAQFYKTITLLKEKYHLSFFDGLEYPLPDSAFGDPTHLNAFGAYLFSRQVNAFINTIQQA